jgi:hypothetical protein
MTDSVADSRLAIAADISSHVTDIGTVRRHSIRVVGTPIGTARVCPRRQERWPVAGATI